MCFIATSLSSDPFDAALPGSGFDLAAWLGTLTVSVFADGLTRFFGCRYAKQNSAPTFIRDIPT
jgi:hypothetical protein